MEHVTKSAKKLIYCLFEIQLLILCEIKGTFQKQIDILNLRDNILQYIENAMDSIFTIKVEDDASILIRIETSATPQIEYQITISKDWNSAQVTRLLKPGIINLSIIKP